MEEQVIMAIPLKGRQMSWPQTATMGMAVVWVLNVLFLSAGPAAAESTEELPTAMWGGSLSRNMVSDEKGLPTTWDVDSGQHIQWSVELGSQTYGGPLIVGDKVLMGTNNQGERNPAVKGDQGVLMAFDRADGSFLWQITHSKLPAGRVNDWPQQGICSTPFVEGERLWYVSNRCELVCADLEGMADGENDGPFTGETQTGAKDGDILWSLDMIAELTPFPIIWPLARPWGWAI